jgi:hypothetical protein
MASAPLHLTSLPQDEISRYLSAGESEVVDAMIWWQAQVRRIGSIKITLINSSTRSPSFQSSQQ